MKLGNTSQSIIPVPNFFLTRTQRDLEIFNTTTSNKKKYFREKDLFNRTKDLNFCNNQRKNHHKYEQFNKEKYVPIHKMEETIRSFSQTISDDKKFKKKENTLLDTEETKPAGLSEYDKFTNYMRTTNITLHTKGDLKTEIRNNIGNLLERINTNFDVKTWNKIDTKKEFNYNNTNVYTPITLYNLTHENESTKFKNSLKDKICSMTSINEASKEKAISHLNRIPDDKSTTSLPFINDNSCITLIKNYSMDRDPNIESNFNKNPNFNKTATISSNSYFKLEENKFKTSSMNDFRTRVWGKPKIKETEQFITINDEEYNCVKHKDAYCEKYNYNLNDGALKRFKLDSEMKKTFS